MISNLAMRQIWNFLNAEAVFDAATIHLFKEDITLSPQTVVADFVEADFTGYTAEAATAVGAAWDDANQNAVFSFSGVHFQPSGTAVANTIYGWWIETTVGGVNDCILRAEKFDSPIPMQSIADAIDLVVRIALGQPVAPIGSV